MEKIKWDLTKEKFSENVKSAIICNNCGWLVSDPKTFDKNKRPPFDENCPNCGKLYKETKSEEKRIGP